METFTRKEHWVTAEEILKLCKITGCIQRIEYESEKLYIVTHLSDEERV